MDRVTIKKPSNDLLEAYYLSWCTCDGEADLLASMTSQFPAVKDMRSYLRKNLPAFHAYCRHKLRLASRAALANDQPLPGVTLTDERRELLLHYSGLGYPLEKCAAMLNVPLVTITEQWYREDELLKEEVGVMRDRYDARVLGSILRRAEGYELNDVQTVEECAEHLGKDGQVVSTKTTRTSTRVNHVPGATAAQKLWAANRFGWTDNPTASTGDDEENEYDIRSNLYTEDDGEGVNA